MKKVLFIAHEFPPIGGSGVQRSSKFVKYLREFGWEPVVLTRQAKNIHLRDDSLLADIPEGTEIIRTKAWDLTALPGIFKYAGKFIARKILIPDGERLWQMAALRTAARRLQKGDIDCVYTTSYPYSDHLLGLKLKELSLSSRGRGRGRNIPEIGWVADFRDEWSNNPYLLDKPHYSLRMDIERRMERAVIAAADKVIANTPVMLENFVKADADRRKKFIAIPNGFDSDDFSAAPEQPKNADRFTLVYTGAFYGRRKPDEFFAALKYSIDSGKIDRQLINVKLIGNFKNEQLMNRIKAVNLEGVVDIMPYMAHSACIAEVRSADALLLIEGTGPGAEAFHTGKLFEYMSSGRPIIAMIPRNGAAAMVIKETSTGFVSDTPDIKGAASSLAFLYQAWREGTLDAVYKPDKKEISRYERRTLTGRLAELLDSIACSIPSL